jgi:hypothetical protein
LAKPFPAPIVLRDKRRIVTLKEAAQFFLNLSDRFQGHPTVIYATELLMIAAETGKPADIKARVIKSRGRSRRTASWGGRETFLSRNRISAVAMPKYTVELFNDDDIS